MQCNLHVLTLCKANTNTTDDKEDTNRMKDSDDTIVADDISHLATLID